jgi:mono/diheme cytochrome c family protein
MRAFVAGVIVTLICVIGGVYAYFAEGFAPVATASQAMPFERKLAHMALNARVHKEMPKAVPVEASEANFLAGAHEYLMDCAVCHGTREKEKTPIARGEFPAPPQLLRGKGVTDDPPGETYWKVAHGIRLTGMPSFDKSLSEIQIWQVSLMLANADKLPVSVNAVLEGQPEVAKATVSAVGEQPHAIAPR